MDDAVPEAQGGAVEHEPVQDQVQGRQKRLHKQEEQNAQHGSAWQRVAVTSSLFPCPGSRSSLIVVSSAAMLRLRATRSAMIENRNLVDVHPLIVA